MAMFAIVYTVFKHVNLWDSKDLDGILLQGDLGIWINKFGLFGNQKGHSYFINCITVDI